MKDVASRRRETGTRTESQEHFIAGAECLFFSSAGAWHKLFDDLDKPMTLGLGTIKGGTDNMTCGNCDWERNSEHEYYYDST